LETENRIGWEGWGLKKSIFLEALLRDVMGLTKINFNSCLHNDRLPVTIRFADAEEARMDFQFRLDQRPIGAVDGISVYAQEAMPETVAVASLLLLALFTAVSMTIVTAGFGLTLSRKPVTAASTTLVPVLGALSLAFGLWYAAAAWALAPYPF